MISSPSRIDKDKEENDPACSFIGSLFFADLENEKWPQRTKCVVQVVSWELYREDASKIFASSSRVFTYSSIRGEEGGGVKGVCEEKKISSPSPEI